MIDVPFVDLAKQHAAIEKELLNAVTAVFRSCQFILGPQVAEFEGRFAALCGTQFAVAVNSGTDALILALRALQIGPGDEVITAPNSFIATASAIALVGARPIFVDVGPDYNIDPQFIERAITSRTKAIVPVHLTGRAADMDQITDIARHHNLPIIEDAAQAVLAEYHGRRVGSLGQLGCFSLHPLKNLNACGDGGIITTNDDSLYRWLRRARNIGLANRDDAMEWSGNSRLDSLQAALLLVKLEYLSEWTNKRREHAAFYLKHLANVQGIELPSSRPHEHPVYHTFVLQADRRDDLKQYLADNGVSTAIHYPVPIHLQHAARELGYRAGDFSVAEQQARRILSLPVYPDLQPRQREHVVNCISSFYSI